MCVCILYQQPPPSRRLTKPLDRQRRRRRHLTKDACTHTCLYACVSKRAHRYLEAFPDGGFFKGKNFVFDERVRTRMNSALSRPYTTVLILLSPTYVSLPPLHSYDRHEHPLSVSSHGTIGRRGSRGTARNTTNCVLTSTRGRGGGDLPGLRHPVGRLRRPRPLLSLPHAAPRLRCLLLRGAAGGEGVELRAVWEGGGGQGQEVGQGEW